MPTFNDGDTGLSVRTKINNAISKIDGGDFTYATQALLDAAPDLSVGDTAVVTDAYNSEPDTFNIVPGGTYTANGATVIDLTASGLQAVSTRMWFKTVAELLADTRGVTHLPVGTRLLAGPYEYDRVASGDLTTAGTVDVAVLPGDTGVDVKAFGATGDGVTDDTTAIQNAINAAATTGKYKVFFPSGHYLVSTLYDHYDAINNPGYPSGNYYQGRIRLLGEKQTDLNQLLYATDYKGVLIETSDAVGPALKMGNGNSADATTARRSAVEHIGFLGTCTGSVVELDGAAQHTLLAHLSVYNKGGSGGKGLYIHNGFYACKVTDVHVASSGGDGLVCQTASMALFDTVNVTNCAGTAWVLGRASTGADDLGFGTGSTFINCQGRNSSNGLEIKGGRSNFFSGWWLEQNNGDFDLKIHENASNYVFQGMLLISTELSVASAIVGGNSGTSYSDACRGIKMQAMAFHFCGPTSAQAGVLKYGSCADLTLDKCSFKNNGGRGLIIDTSAGVTPTILIDPDFDPVGASVPIGDLSKVVDQSGASSPWLVRGLDYVGTITSDLDMSSWTHLPDAINCQTSTNITVTMPSSVAKFIGKTITFRKTLGGNTLAIAGNINGAASVSYTADESVATFIAHQVGLFSEISQPTRVVAPSDPSGGATVDTEARAALALLIDRLQSSGVLT